MSIVDNFECGGFYFFSKIDSGNLGKVELVRNREGLGIGILDKQPQNAENQYDLEFKLWTRPDCAGTQYENQNRTWFYFGITGGLPNQVVKFNVMNLNKQAKLFSQGMQPVMKIGANGKWERIKDKANFGLVNDVFYISFLHKNIEHTVTSMTYYAFTFPFTYTELQDQLAGFDRKYLKTNLDCERIMKDIIDKYSIIHHLNSSVASKLNLKKAKLTKMQKIDQTDSPEIFLDDTARDGVVEDDLLVQEYPLNDLGCVSSIVPLLSDVPTRMSIDDNTSESMQQITNLVHNVKIELPSTTSSLYGEVKLPNIVEEPLETKVHNANYDPRDEIYYCRELVIKSFEGRRIDLVTITSFHGIQLEKEPRLRNLFPDVDAQRCHKFRNKKIVFISSRVHPGETSSSFVLNGFLNLLLDRKNPVALCLRKMYVFKIIPFLNPDGVYNGLYRSDTLGHNLNRVYLTPNIETQPSIYAARKLIRYYHYGVDDIEPYEIDANKGQGCSSTDTSHADDTNMCSNNFATILDSVETDKQTNENSKGKDQIEEHNTITSDSGIGETASSLSSKDNATSSGTEDTMKPASSISKQLDECSTAPSSPPPERSQEPLKVFTEQLIPEIRPLLNESMIITPIRSVSTSISKKSSSTLSSSSVSRLDSGKKSSFKGMTSSKVNIQNPSTSTKNHIHNIGIASKSQIQIKKSSTTKKIIDSKGRPPTPQFSHFRSHRNEILNPNFQRNMNISMDFLAQQQEERNEKLTNEDTSSMFMYLDLHGHASKKGVFMYGNHLPNTLESVECMLLPRLMSLNSYHFHYDACNFSERNMFYKGKRDGLSKEGSGRVAMYLMTGLIKCYTLECNYNTGKSVNILPPKGKEQSAKLINMVPPKYTPTIYEEVGRALGPSILDLTNSNPQTRIGNSEFRTLQGLRNALRIEIERGTLRARAANKVQNSKSKRLINQASGSVDVSKENKVFHNVAWDNMSSSSVGALNSNSNNANNSNPCCSTSLASTAGTSRAPFIKSAGGSMKSIARKSFAKKDVVKKTKVLCDNSVSVASCSNSARSKDQVPRKKIKVSPQHPHGSGAKHEPSDPLIHKYSVDSFDTLCFKASSTTLPNFIASPPTLTEHHQMSKKAKSETKIDISTLEDDSFLDGPCCSYSLPTTIVSPNTLSYIQKQARASSAGSTNTNASDTMEPKMSKFSKATSTKHLVKSKSLDGGKLLKKKRSLKTETNLKRKKTRVKTTLH